MVYNYDDEYIVDILENEEEKLFETLRLGMNESQRSMFAKYDAVRNKILELKLNINTLKKIEW